MGKVLKAVAVIAAAAAIAYFAPQISAAILASTASAATTAAVTAAVAATLTAAVAAGMSLLSSKPRTDATPSIFRQAISNSFIIYGKRRAGGLLIFFHPKGKDFRYFVIAVAGHRCKGVTRWYLGDDEVTVDSSGKVTSGTYANNAWLYFVRGTDDQQAHPTFVSETDGKWTAAHRGRGTALIYAKFKMVDEVVQAGMPNITAEIEGKDDILDPRTGARGYTRNAALVFYDWMALAREEGGFGAYPDEIDWDWVSAQANVCDEDVSTAGALVEIGANAGAINLKLTNVAGLVAGAVVTVRRPSGESEFRTIAAVYSDGLIDVTQGFSRDYPAGSAVYWGGATEKRYTFDSYIQTGAAPSEVRDTFVTCCAGSFTFSGGKMLMRPGYYVPPSAQLQERDLAGPITVPALLAGDEIATEVSGSYVDPVNLYQPRDVPTRSNSDPDVRQQSFDLPHITSPWAGQRLLEIYLRKSAAERRVTWPMNIMGLAISTLDTVTIATQRYGLGNYAFQVTSWGLASDFSVALQLEEHGPEIYEFDPASYHQIGQTGELDRADPIETEPSTLAQLIIANSYPVNISIIGHDEGGSASISVSGHSRVYQDRTVSVAAASIDSLQNSTFYYLYYDDPVRSGGEVAAMATTVFADAFTSSAHPARHALGSITTPAPGGADSGGSGSTPPGGGGGEVNPNVVEQ